MNHPWVHAFRERPVGCGWRAGPLALRPVLGWRAAFSGAAADRGSAALGAAIFTPVFIALLALVIAAGRIQIAQGAADAAARDAARTASLAESPDTAQGEARQAAADSLRRSGLACSDIAVAVESDGIDAPVGQAATVTATVSCTVPLDDVALPALPGSKTLKSTMTSVVDQWRAR
ncbi:TadE/TadG family type IV pilus assembly protein [Streptomyces sp. NBC_00117]|uniref:TadE/TadG family type IV pilus assembly protein n=1 Tax=unclassified Streptomyces TaxID=2593676 RepID=UPI00324DA1C8